MRRKKSNYQLTDNQAKGAYAAGGFMVMSGYYNAQLLMFWMVLLMGISLYLAIFEE